nr:cytochrome P450 CYP72A219-like [Tanacetum cinerariifolium]
TSNDDLLRILLNSNYKEIKQHGSKYELSIEDVIEECKVFYFAGQEATGTMLVWTMILLGHHIDWQKRTREEVLHVFGDKKLDIDGLSHLNVIHEVKMCTSLTSKIFYYDKDTWGEDVHEFNPERFSKGVSKATKGRTTYLPFGGSPRICIGHNFAMLEAKVALTMIIKRFSFEVSPSYAHASQLYNFSTTLVWCSLNFTQIVGYLAISHGDRVRNTLDTIMSYPKNQTAEESQPSLGYSGTQSLTGDINRRGGGEEMRVLAFELVFSLPCAFGSSSRVPMNFDDRNMTLL